jgi:hypothetical protein
MNTLVAQRMMPPEILLSEEILFCVDYISATEIDALRKPNGPGGKAESVVHMGAQIVLI